LAPSIAGYGFYCPYRRGCKLTVGWCCIPSVSVNKNLLKFDTPQLVCNHSIQGAIESVSDKFYLGDDEHPLFEILNMMYSVVTTYGDSESLSRRKEALARGWPSDPLTWTSSTPDQHSSLYQDFQIRHRYTEQRCLNQFY